MNELAIIPECYIDTNLIETLVPPKKGYNHQKGCNTVANIMKGKLKDRFALAIIDKDKKEISYLKECNEITHTTSLYLYKHRTKPHYIIQIAPAVDKFILKCAEETNVSIKDFGFSSDLKEFTNATKTETSKNNPAFKKLFRSIEGAQEMIVLKKWIEYLKENTYNSTEEEFKKTLNATTSIN